MSVDLFLVPLDPEETYESAIALLESLSANATPFELTADVRTFADTILRLDPRYQIFQKDFGEIARLRGISEVDARDQLDWVELNAPTEGGKSRAQFVFYRNYIAIHWYGVTTSDEMDRYLIGLCEATGLAVVDPQTQAVMWLREDGTIA